MTKSKSKTKTMTKSKSKSKTMAQAICSSEQHPSNLQKRETLLRWKTNLVSFEPSMWTCIETEPVVAASASLAPRGESPACCQRIAGAGSDVMGITEKSVVWIFVTPQSRRNKSLIVIWEKSKGLGAKLKSWCVGSVKSEGLFSRTMRHASLFCSVSKPVKFVVFLREPFSYYTYVQGCVRSCLWPAVVKPWMTHRRHKTSVQFGLILFQETTLDVQGSWTCWEADKRKSEAGRAPSKWCLEFVCSVRVRRLTVCVVLLGDRSKILLEESSVRMYWQCSLFQKFLDFTNSPKSVHHSRIIGTNKELTQ